MIGSTTGRGRPRSQGSQQAILAAAFTVLQERGYAGMAIELVAARAGVGKATIYRWWPKRADLAVDAFFTATTETLAFPTTGSAEADFRQQIHQLADLLRSPVGAAMVGMVAGSRADPDLAGALAERWVAPRRRWGALRLERAVAAGECVAGLDVDAALAALYGPLYAPLLMGLGIPDPLRVDAYLAIVFRGIFRS